MKCTVPSAKAAKWILPLLMIVHCAGCPVHGCASLATSNSLTTAVVSLTTGGPAADAPGAPISSTPAIARGASVSLDMLAPCSIFIEDEATPPTVGAAIRSGAACAGRARRDV